MSNGLGYIDRGGGSRVRQVAAALAMRDGRPDVARVILNDAKAPPPPPPRNFRFEKKERVWNGDAKRGRRVPPMRMRGLGKGEEWTNEEDGCIEGFVMRNGSCVNVDDVLAGELAEEGWSFTDYLTPENFAKAAQFGLSIAELILKGQATNPDGTTGTNRSRRRAEGKVPSWVWIAGAAAAAVGIVAVARR